MIAGISALLGLLLAAAPWAGVPLDRLPGLGLGAPSLAERADTGLEVAWRAPLEGGGWVDLAVHPDVASAEAAWPEDLLRLAARPFPALDLAGVDAAAGDGVGWVVARRDNVRVAVRDPAGRAAEVALALLGALQPGPCGPGPDPSRDGCGRLLSATAP